MQISDILTPFTSMPSLAQQKLIEGIRRSRFTPKQTSKKSKKAVKAKITKTEKIVKGLEDMSTEELEKFLEGLK
jgi:hypothetical protein